MTLTLVYLHRSTQYIVTTYTNTYKERKLQLHTRQNLLLLTYSQWTEDKYDLRFEFQLPQSNLSKHNFGQKSKTTLIYQNLGPISVNNGEENQKD